MYMRLPPSRNRWATKQKYLSNRYYDDKIKEFHELRLGQQTMEEYENKFLELLRYVRYIKYENVNNQCFLGGLL